MYHVQYARYRSALKSRGSRSVSIDFEVFGPSAENAAARRLGHGGRALLCVVPHFLFRIATDDEMAAKKWPARAFDQIIGGVARRVTEQKYEAARGNCAAFFRGGF